MSEEQSSEPQGKEGSEVKDYIHPSLQRALEREYSSLPEDKRNSLNQKFNELADDMFIEWHMYPTVRNVEGGYQKLRRLGEIFMYSHSRELSKLLYGIFDIAARSTGGRKMNDQLKGQIDAVKPGKVMFRPGSQK